MVRLEPGAVLTGRLMSTDGEPLAGKKLRFEYRLVRDDVRVSSHYPDEIRTGADGRFRIAGLTPRMTYNLGWIENDRLHSLRRDLRFQSGEEHDLGDIRAERE